MQFVMWPVSNAISPMREMGAYESLWLRPGVTFKSMATKFRSNEGSRPSDFVSAEEIEISKTKLRSLFKSREVKRVGIRIHRTGNYPIGLRDAEDPVELFYYQGIWEFAETKTIAIIGTRNPSREGIHRAKKLARLLVEKNVTVVSGLASGIDTAAHESAISSKGRTIAVIGTPLGTAYPRENEDLQHRIATEHLLISQIPFLRYENQSPYTNRSFFLERNKTMSALTKATIIVEAGQRSGTLTQARAALHQGRRLFLLNNLFERKELTWPRQLEDKGAIRVRRFDDILENI